MRRHHVQLAAAAALNAAIFVVETIAGTRAESLSLVMDGVHNVSDEVALVLLYLAFVLPGGVSRSLSRSATVINSLGIAAVSVLLLWQAIGRIQHPLPISGIVPIVVGLAAAAGNWGVARLLRGPGACDAAVRLAYIHNLGDAFVSLAPVLAGLLVSVTGQGFFEPLIACAIACWLLAAT